MVSISAITGVIGTLFPIIFPEQEFKPKRAIGVLVAIGIAWGMVATLGVEDSIEVLEVAEEVIELTEE